MGSARTKQTKIGSRLNSSKRMDFAGRKAKARKAKSSRRKAGRSKVEAKVSCVISKVRFPRLGSEPPMSAKEAVDYMLYHVEKIFEYDKGALNHLKIEEFQPDDENDAWDITISLLEKLPSVSALTILSGVNEKRIFKVVRIHRKTGELVSIKMKKDE